MTSSGCSMKGGPSKKGKGTNRTGGSAILKLIWGGNVLYFPGFRDLQPYETWKFRICSESVSGVFPDLFRISLRKCLTVLGAPPSAWTSFRAKMHSQQLIQSFIVQVSYLLVIVQHGVRTRNTKTNSPEMVPQGHADEFACLRAQLHQQQRNILEMELMQHNQTSVIDAFQQE